MSRSHKDVDFEAARPTFEHGCKSIMEAKRFITLKLEPQPSLPLFQHVVVVPVWCRNGSPDSLSHVERFGVVLFIYLFFFGTHPTCPICETLDLMSQTADCQTTLTAGSLNALIST